jgi:hypothetical protein
VHYPIAAADFSGVDVTFDLETALQIRDSA